MSNLAIYQPTGKAAEYAAWACNLHTGCSNDCAYCYCKRGPLGTLWTNEPRLKRCFRNEEHAYGIFVRELAANRDALRRDGLLFSFTTDPMLPSTRGLTWNCILTALTDRIPVSVLTKRADFVDALHVDKWIRHDGLAFGFTLTGRDDLEPHASTNCERLAAMRRLHDLGFRTFASLEPVIDPRVTAVVAGELQRLGCCDLLKVGLQSGRTEPYDRDAMDALLQQLEANTMPVYLKHSFTDYFGLPRMAPKDIFKI